MPACDDELARGAHEAATRLLVRWSEITSTPPPDDAALATMIIERMRDTTTSAEPFAALSARDRELLETLRGVVRRTNRFLDRLEQVEMGELAFAENLTSLMRLYWDTAEEMSGRASALFATHPWSALAVPGRLDDRKPS